MLSANATPPSRAIVFDSTSGCTPQSLGSFGGHAYATCGEHWALNKLPIAVRVNAYGGHEGVTNYDVITAANAAAVSWDLVAPVSGNGSRTVCRNAKVICTVADGSVSVNGNDGIVSVVWGSLGPDGVAGMAYVSSAGGLITDVDVVLNSDVRWSNQAVSPAGEAGGALGGICPVAVFCPNVFDLQSILTHELGHVLGLDDLNPGARSCWAGDPADVADYTETMYACYFPGSTSKRTLEAGDVAGLTRVMTRAQTGA